jgi:Domain of unknown function (DUF1906)
MRRAVPVVLALVAVLTTAGSALPACALGHGHVGNGAQAHRGADGGATAVVRFAGERIRVPARWPVYRLAAHPRMCVRLDRRAVYLGKPGSEQDCPAGVIGRHRAILVDPGAERRRVRHAARAGASRAPGARISAAAEFTGRGFDACATPSRAAMSAWGSSPYRAIGVYIGGANRACSQPNLTASWVAEQIAGGWRLIPTYVGLQAPTSSCGSCAKLSVAAAASQGTAAATDAVDEAQIVGIGAGSPIYFDMESYTPTASASAATMAFLAAWTARLHGLGYESGVYSSSASGIADLAARQGRGYEEPDDIWIANWNGQQDAADPYVPASDWSQHQRIHQYRGGHEETWGGVTIDVDNDYVEGATAGATAAGASPRGSFDAVSSPAPGQVRIDGWAFDPDAPGQPVSIRAYLGGKPGQGGATRYELGPVANQQRADLASLYPLAGPAHGFDASFPVVGSGRQRVCVYARNVGPGSDRLLGCRGVGVPVPITLLGLRGGHGTVRLGLRCEWPAGVQCPGQILLRTRVRVRVAGPRRGRVRTRVVRETLARHAFRLGGGGARSFRLGLTAGGRVLVRDRPGLRAQLTVAIPGGRVSRTIALR